MSSAVRALPLAAAVATMLAASLPVASCVQVLGIRELPAYDDPLVARCGGVRYAEEACAGCTDEQCCGEATACAGDPACSAHLDCVSRCTTSDAACRIACGVWSAALPTSPEARLEACRAAKCNVACVGCGSLGDTWGAACSTCLAQQPQCCDKALACAEDAACFAQAACVAGCAAPPCVDRCLLEAPPASFWDLDACFNQCGSACGVGRQWACVGTYDNPTRASGTTTIHARITNLSGTRQPGLVVNAFASEDPYGMSPLGSSPQVTDGEGEVSLVVDLLQTGFDGYLEVQADPNAPGSIPSLVGVHTVFASVRVTGVVVHASQILGLDSTYDPKKHAALAMYATDCLQNSAPGVAFDFLDPQYSGVLVHYLAGSYPDPSAMWTDASGLGYALLTPPEPASGLWFRGTLASTAAVVGKGSVPVRVGAFSEGTLLLSTK